MSPRKPKSNFSKWLEANALLVKLFLSPALGLVGAVLLLAYEKTVWETNPTVAVLSVFLIVVVILLAMLLRMTFRYLQSSNAEIRLKTERRDERHKRFEDIDDALTAQTLRYGHVSFFPTCFTKDIGTVPVGPGIDLLRKVLGTELPAPATVYNWTELFEALQTEDPDHRLDICATPLYDTRERREHVDFSSPLFYADIGLFVCETNARLPADLLQNPGANSFLNVLDLFAKAETKLTVSGTSEELHEKMCEKHFKDIIGRRDFREGHFYVGEALNDLVKSPDEKRYSDILFCECSQVEHLKPEGIINLLEPGQLLFPVCFAIRKGEDTLRKYINLRLMSIEGTEFELDPTKPLDALDPDSLSGVMEVLSEGARATLGDPALFRTFYRRHYELSPSDIQSEKNSNIVSLRASGTKV